MCNCGGSKTQRPPRWVLETPQGNQYFGSRLEADAAYVANGHQGTIKRVT
jgi:hypothetical protein